MSNTIMENATKEGEEGANNRNTKTDLEQLAKELDDLAAKHGMPDPTRRRHILHFRHLDEFDGNTLFDKFARTVCRANVIPRKELFEAWAMAVYVHEYFPESTRIADLACSHGLVSWALLLLSSFSKENGKELPQFDSTNRRSVVCIDICMPKSSEKVQHVMINEFPNLNHSWDYVEGNLEGTIPSPSTLLVGVHCCGKLSDKVIDLAIQGQAPLALVPCCHTTWCLPIEQRETLPTSISKNGVALSNYIDDQRKHRLQNAGYTIQEAFIPIAFTPKNRILLASPPPSSSTTTETTTATQNEAITTTTRSTSPMTVGSTAPAAPTTPTATTSTSTATTSSRKRDWGVITFSIPVADEPTERATIKKLAGRAAANERRRPPARIMSISVFLSSKEMDLSLSKLQTMVQTLDPQQLVDIQVTFPHEEPYQHSNGKYARTFHVHYEYLPTRGSRSQYDKNDPGIRKPITKQRAKELHIELCHRIPKEFPGTTVRQRPK